MRKRVAIPLVTSVVCLAVAYVVPPIVAWLLVIGAFGLILDGVTMMWPRGDNLTKYRQ